MLTQDVPYGSGASNSDVIDNLKNHRLPPPPNGITNRLPAEQQLWALAQECWSFEPSERPTAQHLLERIQGIKRGDVLLSFRSRASVDLIDPANSDFSSDLPHIDTSQ